MYQYNHLLTTNIYYEQEPTYVSKGKLDSTILRYMARRLHLTLRQLQTTVFSRRKRPQVYKLQERHGRMHRIAIYQPQILHMESSLFFVGFISQKQKNLRPSILQEIQRIDKKLVEELADAPGILSYSSLELRNGDWCNLVLLGDANAKMHITSSETHNHAAYHLAHCYYEWIRLHNGVMPEGLDHTEMHLLKSKYYTFHAEQSKPSIRELLYETSYPIQSFVDMVSTDHIYTNTFLRMQP
jgi:hypothetical protein